MAEPHTDATDGKSTLREMIEACAAHGYEYVAITDHTKAVRIAGGLDRAGILDEMAEEMADVARLITDERVLERSRRSSLGGSRP